MADRGERGAQHKAEGEVVEPAARLFGRVRHLGLEGGHGRDAGRQEFPRVEGAKLGDGAEYEPDHREVERERERRRLKCWDEQVAERALQQRAQRAEDRRGDHRPKADEVPTTLQKGGERETDEDAVVAEEAALHAVCVDA